MKCGDRGHVTATGEPCQQNIAASAKACIWHSRTPEERSVLALRGGLASRMRSYLPSSAPRPEFSSTAAVVAWAEATAHKVLSGALDPRAAGEARQLAALTIAARSAEAQERLVDVLIQVEGGGAALVLLNRLREGLGEGTKLRPLPPRALTSREPA